MTYILAFLGGIFTLFLLTLGLFLALQFPYLLLKRPDLMEDFAGLHTNIPKMTDAWQRLKDPGQWWHDFKNLFGMEWARTNLQRAIKFWWTCIGLVMTLWGLDRMWF